MVSPYIRVINSALYHVGPKVPELEKKNVDMLQEGRVIEHVQIELLLTCRTCIQ